MVEASNVVLPLPEQYTVEPVTAMLASGLPQLVVEPHVSSMSSMRNCGLDEDVPTKVLVKRNQSVALNAPAGIAVPTRCHLAVPDPVGKDG